tara:strand:+ start:436 stop:825 length:390 start_codon:yes stop_codon:yes gene_type:complete
MNNKNQRRLLNYLSNFGFAKYRDYEFSNPEKFDFAGIEFIATEKITNGLLNEINSKLTIEAGYPAQLVSTIWGELEDEKFKYMVEIRPNPEVPRKEWEEITERTLASLPKIIKNYIMKNPSKNRKRKAG